MSIFLSGRKAAPHIGCSLVALGLIISIVQDACGQQVIRSTLSSSGHSIHGESVMLLRHTTGQPSPVALTRGEGFVLRQGFQQPIPVSKKDLLSLHNTWEVLIYPNPALVDPTVDVISGVPSGQIEISIYNPLGICIHSERRQLAGAFTIPLTGRSPGQYLIRIVDEKQYSVTKKIIVLQ